MTNQNNIALKEWNVAVDALSQGETILLIRKGGIKETDKSFKLAQERFWLYPTFEHQKPELLKEKYHQLVTRVASGWHPETIEIKCQARVTDSFLIKNIEIINKLLPYHIWNEDFVKSRLQFKAQYPVNIILLRVYNLEESVIIKYQREYGGCKSWINLLDEIPDYNLTPILDDFEYENKVNILNKIIKC